MSTTQQVHKNKLDPPNKEGRGGFGDNPDHRNPGGWKKEMVFSYQYRRFMNMPAEQFIAYADVIKSKKCTMVEMAAWTRVKDMHKSLPDIKEITDRTEGKAQQAMDLTSGGEALQPVLVKFMEADGNRSTDTQ